jgi:hypothetical protein
VARITSITKDPTQPYATVTAEPVALLERSREVLLVWPSDKIAQPESTTPMSGANEETEDSKPSASTPTKPATATEPTNTTKPKPAGNTEPANTNPKPAASTEPSNAAQPQPAANDAVNSEKIETTKPEATVASDESTKNNEEQ